MLALVWLRVRSREESPPLQDNRGSAAALDERRPVAERYAPFIYHATRPPGGRQDLISNVDFDGDLKGANNWENFERFRLRPTVYYAVLETETHLFVSYHLFHPRDWSTFTLWLNDTHENDGENLQVVVRKSDGRPVLLWTQAHFRSRVYASGDSGIGSADVRIAGPLLAVDGRGRAAEGAPHPAVFVEAEGHGIYGAADPRDSEVDLRPDGSWRFEQGAGLLFRPAREGEAVAEPARTVSGEAPYELDSVTVKLWPLLREGALAGEGRLLDGAVRYEDDLVTVDVPRYYEADRFSGPLGSDRGISPFALDFSFQEPDLGALFFNPARRYPERLRIGGAWSRRYVSYPFR